MAADMFLAVMIEYNAKTKDYDVKVEEFEGHNLVMYIHQPGCVCTTNRNNYMALGVLMSKKLADFPPKKEELKVKARAACIQHFLKLCRAEVEVSQQHISEYVINL
jgi:hypothetical protein